jgi:transcription initiation factor TFIIIB Brf1 subunit/transcription initiation factor TFIIB
MAGDEQRACANSFAWTVPLVAGNPLFAVVTDINGRFLESAARVQKDWAEFVHRRVKEDIAVSQRLMKCQSLADMQQIYSQYVQTALEHYREQSERAAQRGKSMTGAVAQSVECRPNTAAEPVRH